MTSFPDAWVLMERLYKCIKGNTKADYREFTTTCIQLARVIDLAVAKNQKLSIVQRLTQLLKKICEQKDNEMFQPAIMVLLLSVKNAICFNWFTPSEGQDVLRMSKELVDFFTGAGGWTAVDSNEASQMISTIIPKYYPLLSLLTVIVALEAKPGYEAMVCDFYVLKKPSPIEELRMFVIRKDNQDTSSCLVTPNNVNFLVNGKGVEKRSLASMEGGPQMPSNVTGMLKIGTNLLQIVGDFPGSYLIAIALTTTTSEFISPLSLKIYNHNGAKAQSDEELIEGPSRVSLLCPISHKRINSPIKGSSCKHHQCFDYNSFMEINSRRPSWRCPFCNRQLNFPDLRLDLQMLKILKETKENAVDLMVSDDGSWETLNEEGKVDKLSRGSKKDLNDGQVCVQKNDASFVELSDNEEPEKGNRIDGLTVGGGHVSNGEGEDRKPDIRELNSTLSTATSIGQSSPGESATTVPHGNSNQSIPQTVQVLPTEGFTLPEAPVERQASREVSRSPIAIQALPAQMSNTNPSYRARPRLNSPHSHSLAQGSGVIHPNNAQFSINQRPLQVQLPSFVGIQDGQVLLSAPQFQHDTDEFLNGNQLQQAVDARDQRPRVVQNSQQHQRPTPSLSAHRGSRDISYLLSNRNIDQTLASDRPSGNQANVRPESANRQDAHLRRLLQTQQTQIQASQPQGVLNSGLREDIASGLPDVLQAAGGSSLLMPNVARRPNSQNARLNVSAQYVQQSGNPNLASLTTNTLPRDQRWLNANMNTHMNSNGNVSDGLTGQVSADGMAMLPDHSQRRMRGSISSPACQTNYSSWTLGMQTQMSQVPTGLVGQLSRFSSNASSSWNNDPMVRQTEPLPRSIQTASTLVSDFDDWLDLQNIDHHFPMGDL